MYDFCVYLMSNPSHYAQITTTIPIYRQHYIEEEEKDEIRKYMYQGRFLCAGAFSLFYVQRTLSTRLFHSPMLRSVKR